MIDNILCAVLTFGLMAAGTIAVGSEMLGSRHAAAEAPTARVTLDPVTIIGHRSNAVVDVTALPMVTITGPRNAGTAVAVETHDAAPTIE